MTDQRHFQASRMVERRLMERRRSLSSTRRCVTSALPGSALQFDPHISHDVGATSAGSCVGMCHRVPVSR